jgi:hypothetical protein
VHLWQIEAPALITLKVQDKCQGTSYGHQLSEDKINNKGAEESGPDRSIMHGMGGPRLGVII